MRAVKGWDGDGWRIKVSEESDSEIFNMNVVLGMNAHTPSFFPRITRQ